VKPTFRPKGREGSSASIEGQLKKVTGSLKSNDVQKVRGATRDFEVSINGAIHHRLYRQLREAVAAIPATRGRELHEIVSQILYQAQGDIPATDADIQARHRGFPVEKTQEYLSVLFSKQLDRSSSNDDIAAYHELLTTCVERVTEPAVLENIRSRSSARGKNDHLLLEGLKGAAIYFAFIGGRANVQSIQALNALDIVAGMKRGKGEGDVRAEARARCSHAAKSPGAGLRFLEQHAADYVKTPEVASEYLSIFEHECRLLYERRKTVDELKTIAEKRVKWFLDEQDERDRRDRVISSAPIETAEEVPSKTRYEMLIAHLEAEWEAYQAGKK
jgi:hypothetical protein